MLYREISKNLGIYLYIFSAMLLVPLFLAIYYQFFAAAEVHPQPHTSAHFFLSILFCLIMGAVFHYFGRDASGHLYRKEGLAIVVIIWLITPFVSALPFLLSGTLKNPFAAYFEATSGLTTTGSTALTAKKYDSQGKEIPYEITVKGVIDTTYVFYGTVEPIRDPKTGIILYEGIEAVSKALLFWRSFIQWLGGGGVIVLFVAILPVLGAGGRVLFQTEVTGPIKDALTPRIKGTAVALWKIYLGLTILEVFLLMATNAKMELFDAVTIAFAAISTGGFSVRNANIGYYQSEATEWVVIICMLLGSINFALYYFAGQGKFYKIFKPEFFLFLIIVALTGGLAAWTLDGTWERSMIGGPLIPFDISNSLRQGIFHIVSAITTSGFFTYDYDIFPYITQVAMVIVMFVGGMSGSTAGGIKIMRHYLLFRIAQHQIEFLFRPKWIQALKVSDKEVGTNTIVMILSFFLIITAVSVFGTFFYVLDGIDPQTAFGLVSCMINDTGLSFRVAGPTGSCAFLSNFSYLLSCALMVMGRLEFFAVFAFLVPAFWKQNE